MFSSSQLAAKEGIYNAETKRYVHIYFDIRSVLRSYAEKRQHKAAERRVNHPHLPYKPLNPYNTPVLPTSPTEMPAPQMPVPQTPSAPPAIRRHLRQESAEDIERRQREAHILQLQERLEKSLQREQDLERQLERETGGLRKQFI